MSNIDNKLYPSKKKWIQNLSLLVTNSVILDKRSNLSKPLVPCLYKKDYNTFGKCLEI